MMGLECSSVGNDTGFIITRRADTWGRTLFFTVGFLFLDCSVALMVFCSLRSARILFGPTRLWAGSGLFVSDWAKALRLIWFERNGVGYRDVH
ncbi:hypothetical protein HG66A1_34900 [Gimesia chilikensis]|uniref:Uncharacterized protein n=1 Tax=Gimesia chilikensis TaxID=2605989 RepID=A0A517PQN9_9PLAN|nr:hypothetical protein HG66A1_34900 [Gimesia chilikensis]